ncbi:hypothetical protein BG004_006845 [Podila humilis]|nr:hypothetical protein BG004_006845 [Podila humilis]
MESSQLLPPPRLATQRKRSYSTTAYSSHEEDSPMASSTPPPPRGLLAVAAGTHVMTFEFANQASETTSPRQLGGILMSSQETTFGEVSSLKWNFDNSIFAVEAQDGRISVYNSNGKMQETIVNEPIFEASLTPGNRCAISWSSIPQRLYYSSGYIVTSWDLVSKSKFHSFEDDTLLAVGNNAGELDVLNRSDGTTAKLDNPVSQIISRLEHSPHKKSILASAGNDGILRLWDSTSTGSTSVLHSYATTHSVPISGMEFSPYNKYLICTTGADRRYALYDSSQKLVVKTTLAQYPLTSVAFKNDGVSMAFGTDQGSILVYDLRSSNQPVSTVDTKTNAPVSAINFQGKSVSSLAVPKSSRQTVSGNALKRQNSAGARSSNPVAIDTNLKEDTTLVTLKTPGAAGSRTYTPMEFAASLPYKSIFSKTRSIMSSTLPNSTSSPSLDVRKISTDRSKADGVTKSDAGVLPAPQYQDIDPEKAVSFKPGRSPPITSIAAKTIGAGAAVGARGLSSSSTPTSVATSTRPHVAPTTPGSVTLTTDLPEQQQQGTYPNSRTSSPNSFQIMQSRSSSGSPSSASSINHTPPGSPAHSSSTTVKPGLTSSAVGTTSQSQLQYRHYKSPPLDSEHGTISPSASRAKRRKSFGTLLASGTTIGRSSIMTAATDPLSKERIDILSGQLSDRVRNVLLHSDARMSYNVDITTSSVAKTATATRGQGIMSNQNEDATTTAAAGKQWRNPLSHSSTTPNATSTPPIPSQQFLIGEGTESGSVPETVNFERSRPIMNDLWMQAGSLANGKKGSGSSQPMADGEGSSSSLPPVPAPVPITEPVMMLPSFSSKVLENVIEECLVEFRAGIRNDIQNMHLELLRQFQIQKLEIGSLLKEFSDTRELKDQIERLEEENRRLKTNY